MTVTEYQKQANFYQKEYEEKIRKLKKDFAVSNNPYKIGDIIKDHYQCIKIDNIKWKFAYYGNNAGLSECVYIGPRLKKDLSPFKSGEIGTICQSNIEEVK